MFELSNEYEIFLDFESFKKSEAATATKKLLATASVWLNKARG